MAISACNIRVSPIETKSELRQFYRKRLRALSAADRLAKNAAIAALLTELTLFSTSQSVMSYLSFGTEVDTRATIAGWLKENRRVYAPRVVEKAALEWVTLSSLDVLTTGAHGVPEPVGPATESAALADTPIIVPGLAFTKDGQRLGRGLGVFDRFLAGHAGTRIGLAFGCQVAEALTTEAHDIPMDIVITESGVYHST